MKATPIVTFNVEPQLIFNGMKTPMSKFEEFLIAYNIKNEALNNVDV